MIIAVVDGQGGGIGKALVERIKNKISGDYELLALGTNSVATSTMIKAGADRGATGENSIKVMSQKADIIVGPIAIMVADSMLGEITSIIASSISTSNAKKILLPLNRCNMFIAGVEDNKLSYLLDSAISEIQRQLNDK